MVLLMLYKAVGSITKKLFSRFATRNNSLVSIQREHMPKLLKYKFLNDNEMFFNFGN